VMVMDVDVPAFDIILSSLPSWYMPYSRESVRVLKDSVTVV